MKPRIVLLACALATFFSCNKNTEGPIDPINQTADGKIKEVRISLSGDLSVDESPLGRKTGGGLVNAKVTGDSILYMIVVQRDYRTVYKGVYNRIDSVLLKIPASGNINVSATAFKKSSGGGLYGYYIPRDSSFYYFRPLYSAVTNRIDTGDGSTYNSDSLRYIPVFDVANSSYQTFTLHTEIDTYFGETSFTAANVPQVINIKMRRIVFGIRYNATNFNSGRLIADFSGTMPTRYITPSDDPYRQYVYTAAELALNDSLYRNPVTMNMKWERPDGSVVTLGQRTIAFKRNVLTTINVTIPSGTSVVPPISVDTTWKDNASVSF